MGEIAEMMLEGVLCEGCGEYLGDGDGFPVRCAGCGGGMAYEPPDRRRQAERRPRKVSSKARQRSRDDAPFTCSCGRRFYAELPMAQHRLAKGCKGPTVSSCPEP